MLSSSNLLSQWPYLGLAPCIVLPEVPMAGLRGRDAPMPPLGGDVSPDLDRFLQRALARAPEACHGNVRDLASELRAVLRTSESEQLRSSAQQWEDGARAPGLLWGGDVLPVRSWQARRQARAW